MGNELTSSKYKGPKSSFNKKTVLRDYSNQIILASFLIIILLGSLMFRFGPCVKEKISFMQAFFMATSATCVTGLSILDITKFTMLGKIITLLLIQIGGLGLMTLSFFLVAIIYHELGLRSTSIAKDFLSLNSSGNIKNYIILIIKITLLTELFGAIILFFRFLKTYKIGKAAFLSIFYAVSAYCNAGITLHRSGLDVFFDDKVILFTIQLLVFLGSIGFFVFYEMFFVTKEFFAGIFGASEQKGFQKKISLHSKIVLKSFFYLLSIGTLFFLAVEKNKLFAADSWIDALIKSFVYNISLRSSGFTIFAIDKLSDASLLFSMACMTIGAAPGSTGGGVKVTTFAIFVATLISILRGKSYVEIGNRTIAEQQIYKSISILVVSLMWVFCSTFILLLVENQLPFLDLFFESCSSLFNVGLSTGITSRLGIPGQIILIINMIAGRIGILTFIFAIRNRYEKQLYKFPVENVILG